MFIPELLTSITEAEVGRFIVNKRQWLQPKHDGDRLAVRRRGEHIEAWNKYGETSAIPQWLLEELLDLNVPHFLFDGELEAGAYPCFDLLEADGTDLRKFPYEERFRVLKQFHAGRKIEVVRNAESQDDKEAMLFELLESGVEGAVFKKRSAPYRSGRSGQHHKFKFVDPAVVRVKEIDPDRDSVTVEMLDGTIWREVCGLKVPRASVSVGQFLQVRYSTGTENKSLVQPVLADLRPRALEKDCSWTQVKFRGRWAYLRPKTTVSQELNREQM